MPDPLGFFGPSFDATGAKPLPYDSSMINMYLGDDPRSPIGPAPVPYPSPNNPYADFVKPPQGTAYDSSIINMYLGDDFRPPIGPAPNQGLVWDGRSRGPESLLWLKGEIPDAQGNYNRPPSGTKPFPIGDIGGGIFAQKQSPSEEQLRQEYQEYMNSIGNPPTVTNDYFYWRAERLADIDGGIFAPEPPPVAPVTERRDSRGNLLNPNHPQGLWPYPKDNPPMMTNPVTGEKTPIPEDWWIDYQTKGSNFDPRDYEYSNEAPSLPEPKIFYEDLPQTQPVKTGPSHINDITKAGAGTTGGSSWHESQCKRYGASRGCDLDKAKENHKNKSKDKFKNSGFCPVSW